MTKMLLKRARGEEGYALVTAVAMMSIMLMIGLATMRTVDFSQDQTREQRELESSLNLAEGVLYAQSFALARNWPRATGTPYPRECSSGAATTGRCPNRENLAAANARVPGTAAFNGVDFSTAGADPRRATGWVTRVRDNYGPLATAYSSDLSVVNGNLTPSGGGATCPGPCTRDFNEDRALWVEARTIVRGKARKIAALMRLEMIQESIPQTGMTSGAIALTNNGAGSYSASGAPVIVRCNPDRNLGNAAVCTNMGNNNNIDVPPVQGTVGNLMTPEQIERFRERAIIDGTWYAGCPPTLTGAVVFVEHCPAENNNPGRTYTPAGTVCSTGSPPLPSGMSPNCANSIQRPGIVIVRCGGLRISGGTYVGVLYFVNGSDNGNSNCNGSGMPSGQTTGLDRGNPSQPVCPVNGQRNPSIVVLDVQNGGGIWGAIAADGGACIQLGSNGLQFDFDPNVFNAVQTYGTVGLVQNTWRELPPGQG